MIYTLTLNPSLDYILECRDIILGETNKAQKEKIFVGGKGINVSIVLKTLGFDSVALGFLAGFTGDEIKKRLDELNLQSDFIYLKNGSSRINIKLKNYSNLKASERLETEINASGPSPNQEEIQKLLEKLILLKDNDILILSGSVPPYNSNIYETIIEKTLSLNKKN